MSWLPLLSAGISYALQGWQNNVQVNQQARLDQVQTDAEEQQATYGLGLQEQMWNYTNYPNQVNQLNQAGLNPALLYGKGGAGGGMTASMGIGGAAGATATQPANTAQLGMMGIQAAEAMADIKLKDSQSKNIDADTVNKPKVGANLDASTQNLLEGVNTQEAQQGLIDAQTTAQQIGNKIQGKSADDQIATIKSEMYTAAAQMLQAEVEGQISKDMMNQKKSIIATTALNSYLQTLKTSAETQNLQQQTAESKNRMQVANQQLQLNADQLRLNWDEIHVDDLQRIATTAYQQGLLSLGNKELFIQGAGTIINALKSPGGTPKGTKPPPVQGFNQKW